MTTPIDLANSERRLRRIDAGEMPGTCRACGNQLDRGDRALCVDCRDEAERAEAARVDAELRRAFGEE